MELLELTLLAIASAFWPVLVVVDLVALRAPRPIPLLAWFLAGGLLTTISEGLAIVFLLESTRFVIPFVPGISAVQGAAVREFLVAALLLAMLRYRPVGLLPEQLTRFPVPPKEGRYQPTA